MKKLKEYALYALLGVLAAVVLVALMIAALWLYGQPREVRNTIAVVVAGVDVLCLVLLLVPEWIAKRRRRRHKVKPDAFAQYYSDALLDLVSDNPVLTHIPANPIPKKGGKPVKFRGIQTKEEE